MIRAGTGDTFLQFRVLWRKDKMKIEPNEIKEVEREYWKTKIPIWNRTDKPIYVYYTSKGIEVQGVLVK